VSGLTAMTARVGVRLLDTEELTDRSAQCVEVQFGHVRIEDDRLTVRITPVDLIHLMIDGDQTLTTLHSEILREKAAWEKARSEWHEEGRRATEAYEPNVAMLRCVLQALRRDELMPT
jgi:hypothetical protein